MTLNGFLNGLGLFTSVTNDDLPEARAGVYAVVTRGDENTEAGSYDDDRTNALLTVAMYQASTGDKPPPIGPLEVAFNRVMDDAVRRVDTDRLTGQAISLDRVTAVQPRKSPDGGNFAVVRWRYRLSRPT